MIIKFHDFKECPKCLGTLFNKRYCTAKPGGVCIFKLPISHVHHTCKECLAVTITSCADYEGDDALLALAWQESKSRRDADEAEAERLRMILLSGGEYSVDGDDHSFDDDIQF